MRQQAQKMQKKVQDAQADLSAMEIGGEAGNGAVKVICNGQGKFKSIKLAPEAINPENPSAVDQDTLEMLEELIDSNLVDAVAMDIKSSKAGYLKACGADDEKTQNVTKSVEIIMKKCKKYEFRTTLVANLITENDIKEMAKWLSGAQKLYLQKFEDKGGNLTEGLSAVSREDALKFKAILAKTIPEVNLRGYN